MQRTVLVLVATVGVLSMAQQIKCRSPSRFMIPVFKANWFKATEFCFSLGMQLAITNSKEDHDRIVDAVKASPIYNANDTIVWIGGSDLAVEGDFYWHATGVRLVYAHWQPGQPDNWKNQEDCLSIVNVLSLGWRWVANDGNCEGLHYFVCENVEWIHNISVF
ncbi:lectin subunit alpha-like [Armigeres subalbatus]|uniref:lectin subunit alpha-like n=1 Tax=Armigeres subalbatus TaxID=124917 RepID=UPI002ED4BA06